MGLLSGIKGSLMNTLTDLPSTIIGGLVGGKLDRYNKKKEMDSLYPGTNPWERLGAAGASSGSGNSASASRYNTNVSAVTARRGQDVEAETKKEVARIQATAGVSAARIHAEPGMVNAGVNLRMFPHRKRLVESQSFLNRVRSSGIQLDNIQKEELSKFAKELARANLTYEQTKTYQSLAINAMRGDVSNSELLSALSANPQNASSILNSLFGIATKKNRGIIKKFKQWFNQK